MAVNFTKGAGKAPAKPAATQPPTGTPSFMKKGAAAVAAIQKDQAEADARPNKEFSAFRVWMPVGKELEMTFLDGKLDADGVLDAPMFYEHQLKINDSWQNWLVCPKESEPCPVCEGGDNSQLVAAFTVIDHSSFTSKKGHTYANTRKLMVCKRETFNMLQKLASTYGGLAGCTFIVSRNSANDAAVGGLYIYKEKRGKQALIAAYPNLKDTLGPLDYAKEFPYYTAEELRNMGFGSGVIGNEKAADDDWGTPTVPGAALPGVTGSIDDEL